MNAETQPYDAYAAGTGWEVDFPPTPPHLKDYLGTQPYLDPIPDSWSSKGQDSIPQAERDNSADLPEAERPSEEMNAAQHMPSGGADAARESEEAGRIEVEEKASEENLSEEQRMARGGEQAKGVDEKGEPAVLKSEVQEPSQENVASASAAAEDEKAVASLEPDVDVEEKPKQQVAPAEVVVEDEPALSSGCPVTSTPAAGDLLAVDPPLVLRKHQLGYVEDGDGEAGGDEEPKPTKLRKGKRATSAPEPKPEEEALEKPAKKMKKKRGQPQEAAAEVEAGSELCLVLSLICGFLKCPTLLIGGGGDRSGSGGRSGGQRPQRRQATACWQAPSSLEEEEGQEVQEGRF